MAFKVELRKIHVDTRMSEETNCYSAELFVNDKKVGIVSNHGHGGCDDQHIDSKSGWTVEKLDAECKANYPATDMSQFTIKGAPMEDSPADLESVCGNLIDRHLTLKSHRRAMSSKVLVLGDKKGEVRSFSWKGVKKTTQAHIDGILKSHPEFAGKVLNLMNDEQIWELCK